MALISLNNLERFFNNLKTYISNALSSKANTSHTHTSSDITDLTVDSALSSSSENPVQNKVVKNALDGKIPLSGTNALSGSIVPDTDNSVDLGASSKNIKMIYTKGITINGTQFLPSDYVTLNDAQTIPGNKTFSGLTKTTGKYPYSYSGNDLNNAIYNIETTYWEPDTANRPSSSNYGTLLSFNREVNVHTSNGTGWIAQLGIGTDLRLYLRTKTNVYGSWENWKEFITIHDAVPRSGGAVLTGTNIGRADNTGNLDICGGTSYENGAFIALRGIDIIGLEGVAIIGANSRTAHSEMWLHPNGTWTWTGTACQITSDQRFKQQINAIDDDLLTAWKDVNLVQFKYNDAVDQKGDNARLHTGYVVQQINEACKSHNVDISQYGLYCHEEYKEETEEVENEDGTKETKVIRPASEHYSLRYTEALIVECAYLRKCIKELKEEIKELKNKD